MEKWSSEGAQVDVSPSADMQSRLMGSCGENQKEFRKVESDYLREYLG